MNLETLIDRFEGRRIVVLGDLIADVFVHGEISRVSREAPVLILSHRDTRIVPGGAANAVHNLWALGAAPLPVGVVGDDQEGRALIDCFTSLGIDTAGIRTLSRYPTPTKTRILAGAAHANPQQVLRIDAGGPLRTDTSRTRTLRSLKARLKRAHAVLVSDYGYGLVDPTLISHLQNAPVPVTVDSRFDIGELRGLTAATPNEPEVEAVLGTAIDDDPARLERAGRILLRRLGHRALLVTRGKKGMALFERGQRTVHIPIHGTDEIADVTGAGDTVISVFTLGLAAGATFQEAARLANYAGGIVVMKHGTRTVTREEIRAAVGSPTS